MKDEYDSDKDKYDWAGFVQSRFFGILWIGSIAFCIIVMFVLFFFFGKK